ncbi:LVIVD repeat-containing protein [Halorarum salinum]|uniref:LVIVD repeat-containing protein n=1 Tax=Halorarum salinum TaxID=2743089 RepID=A0A7D5QIB5_9EURY|nr:hypothetical protein [Halobaculum salinum]QLG62904.1 hypothetical protein HUG12_14660 [Halobaculum salinum]
MREPAARGDGRPTEPGIARRDLLRAGTVGVALAATTGTASAHEYGSSGESTDDGDHGHADGGIHGATNNVDLLDYHSVGDVGPSSESGRATSPHYGALSEIRVEGDHAYVSVFSSKDPTNNRGLAILDVSAFEDAENASELREAELEVVSFLRNDNDASAVMDVKVSDDGDYVFISKQPYTALFGETDPTADADDGDATTVSAAALQAVDVSDPENPLVVGTYDGWDTGPHNSWYHRIGGAEYVFGVKDLNDGSAALYVFRFDRTTGALVLVNEWNVDGNLPDLGTGGTNYIHDITVQDDERLDGPVGYLSYWDQGLWALDLSDPTDIQPLGHFSMGAAHYAEPTPTYVDGKRVVVAGQEISGQEDGSSGKVYLLDADGLDDGFDGSDNVEKLDEWEWKSNVTFENFTLSPHNFNVTERGYVHLGHYHGGTRFLRIDEGDWTLAEKGYFQAAEAVPEESKMEGLNHAAPFTWAAVAQNGVTYVSDANTGVYALRFKPDSSGDDLKSRLGLAAGAAGLGGLLTRDSDRVGDVLERVDE